ncbi:hypothetical protein ABT354_17480 [Streptomyces sp. NPDC000594]|uniref:effector-associated constant component EACC1 n=1 Tax=Streptomyces sp. NPDC000594 TaxID=3154261 RepID=UPI003322CB31
MQIQISAPELEDGDRTVADLHRWLRRDDTVRRDMDIRLAHRTLPGAMGTVDLIDLIVGQSVAVLNLALSYAAWRAARRTAPAVTLTVDGVSLTLSGASDDEVRRMVALLSPPPPLPSEPGPGPGPEPEDPTAPGGR